MGDGVAERASGSRDCPAEVNGNAAACCRQFVTEALADSDRFFSYEPPRDYSAARGRLTFTSPVQSRIPENNTVHGRWFPAEKARGRALVVLPQWNSDAEGHVGLAKLLNRFGISALRMTMAYHAERKPAELQRADYHVSSNVGRTIHACRQSVIDTRACLDWLMQQGYERIGILGTSLGSCVAFIARRTIRAFAPASSTTSRCTSPTSFGPACPHKTCGRGSTAQSARTSCGGIGRVISPAAYLERLRGRDLPALLDLGAARFDVPPDVFATGA